MFSPSYASPDVSAPSPRTATTLKSSPWRSRPAAMPSAAEIDVAAWPAPNASYSLSVRLRKPDRPFSWRSVSSPIVAAGEHLVRIALMPDVPDELVARRVERVVQRDRQLDDAEPGADVPAGARADVDQARADVVGELRQLVAGEPRSQRAIVTRSRMLMRVDAAPRRKLATCVTTRARRRSAPAPRVRATRMPGARAAPRSRPPPAPRARRVAPSTPEQRRIGALLADRRRGRRSCPVGRWSR